MDMCDQPCFGKAGLPNNSKNFIYKGQEGWWYSEQQPFKPDLQETNVLDPC